MSAYEHPSSTIRQNIARRGTRTSIAQRLLLAMQRWQRNRAVAAIQALPDIYLDEIGMARSDITQMGQDLFPTKGNAVPLRQTGESVPGTKTEFRNAA